MSVYQSCVYRSLKLSLIKQQKQQIQRDDRSRRILRRRSPGNAEAHTEDRSYNLGHKVDHVQC